MTYEFTEDQCDVQNKEALARFRAKRSLWLEWLNTDEHHPLFSVIGTMVWTDVSFRALATAGELEPAGGLSNPLVAEALINGHFATQTLAIRRLIDGHPEVISIVRLLRDIGENIHLFTRENFVAFNGLPYDYEAAQERVRLAGAGKRGPFFRERTGPNGYWVSEIAHREFDRVSGTTPDKRSRTDVLPKSFVEDLQKWVEDSSAKDIVTWTHKFLAHAADKGSRSRVDKAAVQPNLGKLTEITRVFVRVSEAVHALFLSGHGEVMPMAQFDPFEHLTAPLLEQAHESALRAKWDELTEERNHYRDGVLDELLGVSATGSDGVTEAPSFLEVIHDAEWLNDPEGKCDREIERCLEKFRAKRDGVF